MLSDSTPLRRTVLLTLCFAAIVVYVTGLFMEIMEIDAAQYAALSQRMAQTGNYLQLFNREAPYLDKPPMLFWLSSISLAFGGPHPWVYKLPSLLVTLLGIFSTMKLGEILYGRRTGQLAALLLGCSFAWFFFTNDARTDAMLTGWMMFGLWQLEKFRRLGGIAPLILAAVGFAGAMLSKGPIGLMVPVLAVAVDLIGKRQWKELVRPAWFVLVAIVFILLLPWFIGQYKQYGINGIIFFLWTQSFGRITGQNVWANQTDPFFFLHSFLWAFLPWSWITLYGLWKRGAALVKTRFAPVTKDSELLTVAGILFPALVLSASHYKLPHYIFVVFPLCAILAARTFETLSVKESRVFLKIQFVTGLLLFIFSIVALFLPFPGNTTCALIPAIVVLLTGILFLKTATGNLERMVVFPALSVISVFLVLNLHFGPRLLDYQASSTIGKLIASRGESNRVSGYRVSGYMLDFYSQRTVPRYRSVDSLLKLSRPQWIVTDSQGYQELQSSKIPLDSIKEFSDFPVTRLNGQFLLPWKRDQVLRKRYLLRMADDIPDTLDVRSSF